VDELVGSVGEALGCRLMDLYSLYRNLADVGSETDSPEAFVESWVKEFVDNKIRLNTEAIKLFMAMNRVSPHKLKDVFSNLIDGKSLDVQTVAKQLEVPIQAITCDVDVAAHVFYVHPETREVFAESNFMLQAMKCFNSKAK